MGCKNKAKSHITNNLFSNIQTLTLPYSSPSIQQDHGLRPKTSFLFKKIIKNFKMLHTYSDQLDILAFWAYHQAYLDPKMQKQTKK